MKTPQQMGPIHLWWKFIHSLHEIVLANYSQEVWILEMLWFAHLNFPIQGGDLVYVDHSNHSQEEHPLRRINQEDRGSPSSQTFKN